MTNCLIVRVNSPMIYNKRKKTIFDVNTNKKFLWSTLRGCDSVALWVGLVALQVN